MTSDAPSVWLTTLGCAKNQVDSDKISARLAEAGYRTAGSVEAADVVMVNTCAFIEAARRESIDTVLDAVDRSTAERNATERAKRPRPALDDRCRPSHRRRKTASDRGPGTSCL